MTILCRHNGSTLERINDGAVLSCNPTSTKHPYGPYHFSFAPAGTNGPYEQVNISGNIATYCPLGNDGVRYLISPVPNAGAGALAINPEPLA